METWQQSKPATLTTSRTQLSYSLGLEYVVELGRAASDTMTTPVLRGLPDQAIS
jgi:hypothetical protein